MKKNKKQRFISDKISELREQGKNQQQSIAIALSMAENILQDGGTQPYTGKGYGKNMQEASKTVENNSWYFTDEEKKNRFLNATSTKGGSKEIIDFQNAYNTEMSSKELNRRRKRDWIFLLIGVPAFIALLYLIALALR